MRTQTNYKKLLNRCPFCGHRWKDMHGNGGCTVDMGDGKTPETITPCPCKRRNR